MEQSSRPVEKWSELPEPLVDWVIARLPLSGLFQARTLCKRWNSCFLSQEFRSMFAERLVQSRYMGLFVLLRAESFDESEDGEGGVRRSDRDSVAYDFTSNRWQKLPPPPRLPRTMGQVRVTGVGGLLLFSYVSKEKRMIHVVSNLLSGQVRELPDTPHSPMSVDLAVEYMFHLKECSLLRMVMSRNRSSCCVVLVDDEQLTHVFDSSTNAWAVTGRSPLHPLVKCSSAYSNGFLFCLGLDSAGNYGIMSYNFQRTCWELPVHDIPRQKGQAVTNIVERGDSILIVSEKDEIRANIKHVSVFKCDPSCQDSDWELLAEMPYETCGPCGDSYTCISDKDRHLFSRIFVGSLQMPYTTSWTTRGSDFVLVRIWDKASPISWFDFHSSPTGYWQFELQSFCLFVLLHGSNFCNYTRTHPHFLGSSGFVAFKTKAPVGQVAVQDFPIPSLNY